MGIQLDEHSYQKLIDENIDALNKHMPEHSLEKKHIIEVLKWSVQQIYHSAKGKATEQQSNCNMQPAIKSVCGKCGYDGKMMKFNKIGIHKCVNCGNEQTFL